MKNGMGNSEIVSEMKELSEEILGLIDQKEISQAFDKLKKGNDKLQNFFTFLDTNDILSEEDFRELLTFFLQSMEMEDSILLEDVLRYSILDVIRQLLGEEAMDNE